MRLLPAAAALLLAMPVVPANAQRAGDFDYYLLALSWTPSWCETTGDARGAAECEAGAGLGFILHGLWPQYEDGWPEWCEAAARDPTRAEAAAMADVMGSGGLAWHQWQKHGRCSGLEPEEYFALARSAVAGLEMPEGSEAGITSPAELEAAFLAQNPGFAPDGLIVTCRADLVKEVRVCLDRDLDPRACAPDVLDRECRGDRTLAQPPPR